MFVIHQSNQMEILATQLCGIMARDHAEQPFAQEVVLVQSPGMSQWLKILLAQQLGVMANVDFPLPSSFIWSLYKTLISDLPDQSAFNKIPLSWKLYSLLPDFLDDEAFLPLRFYLADDQHGLKRFQLSEKIADVFDQYLMYRPDWICAWEEGEDPIVDGDVELHPWQPKLWRALTAQTIALGQSMYHRANLHEVFLAELARAFADPGQALVAKLPKRLFVFGISALPSQQLQVFEQLAQHMDIHLMLFNPCAHYWGDIIDEKQLAKVEARFANKKHLPVVENNYLTVGNPLLASWGKLGRDYLEQLLEVEAVQFDYFVEPQGDTLLSRIQADVFNLAFRDQLEPLTPQQSITDIGKQIVTMNDHSLRFHSCHSPLREVEVLYDQLLNLFSQDGHLTPKDVIVMMPDVSLYSPYIDAVFAASDSQRIPYAISDKGFALENPILNSFLQLMRLPDSRFCASELLDLISVPATIAALGLAEQDIDLISYWIDQVGIRWGIDGPHKQSLNLPDDQLNSWRFGLDRLLLGYAIGNEKLVDGILPFKQVEGQTAEILGKLVRFIDGLMVYRQQLAPAATISEKMQIVTRLLDQYYLPSQAEEQALNTIRQVLIEFENQQHEHHCTVPISQKVFAYALNQAFSDKGVGQRFLAGQVNFCTLMPMRSIPFKVICLLGMNDADYPRFVAPIGFDLMASGKARKGDRSRRLDDRYLLLEAMLSAREKLYISYVGRSMQDNSEKIPSVLVTELIEYCEQAFQLAADHPLVVEHPLQPFNPSYFQGQFGLVNFQPHWYRYSQSATHADVGSPTVQITPIQDPNRIETIELAQLLRFMIHPVRYFFNQTLQLHFATLDSVEQDDETFALDALQRYQLLDGLAAAKLTGSGLDSFLQVQAAGHLPHREVGKIAFAKLEQQADSFVAALGGMPLEPLPPVEVNLQLDGIALLGWVKNLTSHGLLFYRPAKITAKDRLVAWLQHVVLAAMGRSVSTRHVGLAEQEVWRPLAQPEAMQIVQQWVAMYLEGLKQPLPFFAKSSEKWSQSSQMSEVAKLFNGSSFTNVPGEGDDLYIARVYRDLNTLPEQFKQLATMIYDPLFAALKD